jgi:hypothetical protein
MTKQPRNNRHTRLGEKRGTIMKITKTLSAVLAAAATVALLGSSAQASLGTTTDYLKLSISLTVTTNRPSHDNGQETTYKTGSMKVVNKDLLKLFAHWATNDQPGTATFPFPAGAQLVLAYDNNSDVVVVDKTETNILYDATATADTTTHLFSIDFFEAEGPYTEIDADTGPKYDGKELYLGEFELLDDLYLGNTDVTAQGPSELSYSQNSEGTDAKESICFEPFNAGVTFLNSSDGSVSGQIDASGKHLSF